MFTVAADLMDDVYTTMMDSFPQQLDFLLERPDMFCRYEYDDSFIMMDRSPKKLNWT